MPKSLANGFVCDVGDVFRFIPQPRWTPPRYEQALGRGGGPWSSQLTSFCMEAPLLTEAGVGQCSSLLHLDTTLTLQVGAV